MKIVRYDAAGGVVIDGDDVLVLRRPARGQVRLPKGHVEENEDVAAAAEREVAEEAGVVARIVADLGEQDVEFEWEPPGEELTHFVRHERYFLMHPTGEAPRAHEVEFEPVWMPLTEAVDALSFEAEREWLRRALAYGA